MLQQFLELEESALCTSLTDVLCGGGELHRSPGPVACRRACPRCACTTSMAPPEATVDSSAWTLEPARRCPRCELPIGRAINNTRLYVLDEHDAPVPMGVSGQLHIGRCRRGPVGIWGWSK